MVMIDCETVLRIATFWKTGKSPGTFSENNKREARILTQLSSSISNRGKNMYPLLLDNDFKEKSEL